MNMAATFFAARPAAQHCAELTWRGPRPEERTEAISSWCRDLSQDLGQELGQILTGGKLKVTLAEPEMLSGADVFERIGPVAVNTLLRCGSNDQTVLLSLDFATAIALTDCSFGGRGSPPDQVPEQLPRSAAMLVEQFAGAIAQTIAMSSGSSVPVKGDVLVRSESVTRLKPFSALVEVALFRLTIAMAERAEWHLLLGVQSDRLDGLLPGASTGRSAGKRSFLNESAEGGPFADMPLKLEAVLSEFDLALERLETLTPGDEIPLAIPRELSLRIGDDVFAHGVVGTLENQLALRLTRVPHQISAPISASAPYANGLAASEEEITR